MWHEGVARELSRLQRDMLVAHVDGPVAIVDHGTNEARARMVLVNRELLRGCTFEGHANRSLRPQATTMTDDGRQVLAWVLAHYADALIEAGMLELEVLGPTLAPAVNVALTELRYRRSHETATTD